MLIPRRRATGVVAAVVTGTLVLAATTSSDFTAIRTIAASTAASNSRSTPATAPGSLASLALAGLLAPPTTSTPARPRGPIRAVVALYLPPGPMGIPGALFDAYHRAADRLAAEEPSCGINWSLIAAIGRIESGHADDGSVDTTGKTLTPIRGPVLDGSLLGNAVIIDSDSGGLDGSPVYDRAIGPMQFLPQTWAIFGGDANGDGISDPDNIYDAAYGAARYLCSGGGDLRTAAGQERAVFSYNHSQAYVDNVLAWAKAYRVGGIPVGGIPEVTIPKLPPPPPPPPPPPLPTPVACPVIYLWPDGSPVALNAAGKFVGPDGKRLRLMPDGKPMGPNGRAMRIAPTPRTGLMPSRGSSPTQSTSSQSTSSQSASLQSAASQSQTSTVAATPTLSPTGQTPVSRSVSVCILAPLYTPATSPAPTTSLAPGPLVTTSTSGQTPAPGSTRRSSSRVPGAPQSPGPTRPGPTRPGRTPPDSHPPVVKPPSGKLTPPPPRR